MGRPSRCCTALGAFHVQSVFHVRRGSLVRRAFHVGRSSWINCEDLLVLCQDVLLGKICRKEMPVNLLYFEGRGMSCAGELWPKLVDRSNII